MLRKILIGAALVVSSAAANAVPVLTEGFDDINALGAADWMWLNNSTPGGSADPYFQGDSGVFAADSGAADSYIASNFVTAGFGGNVDDWLVTPLISAVSGSLISFSTRTAGNLPGDNLELLYNNKGTTFLSDFVSMGTIGSAGYPLDWTNFDFIYTGADAATRFAFRYTVSDTSANGDYIGIDSLVVDVPEPGTMMLLGAGLLLMPLTLRRRRRDQI